MLPMYNTKIFSDIFPTFNDFKKVFDDDFDSYAKDCISATSLKTLYWLIYAKYANSPISNYNEKQFKSQIVAITYEKAPTWERKLALQKTLRELTDADLLQGARTILNRALHPDSAPGTDTDTELNYISAQDVSKHRRSKIDAYSYLQDVLKNDVSSELIRSYAKLFSRFVGPTITRIYENDVDEDEPVLEV